MAYAQGSAERARMPAPQLMRLPEDDRSWAQDFLNQWESADDADGQRQVFADYSADFPDSRRCKALGELVVERLSRKAEIERMNPVEQMERMAKIDASPLMTGTYDDRSGMPGPANRRDKIPRSGYCDRAVSLSDANARRGSLLFKRRDRHEKRQEVFPS